MNQTILQNIKRQYKGLSGGSNTNTTTNKPNPYAKKKATAKVAPEQDNLALIAKKYPATPAAPHHRLNWSDNATKKIVFREPPTLYVGSIEIDHWRPTLLHSVKNTDSGQQNQQQKIRVKKLRNWTEDELRLLRLISLYCGKIQKKQAAKEKERKTTFLRGPVLMLMAYEAIVGGAISFNYSPQSTQLVIEGEPRRVWLNISQDVFSSLNKFREEGLIEMVKRPTEHFLSSWSCAITLIGESALSLVPIATFKQLDYIVHGGLETKPDNLLQAKWNADGIRLVKGDRAKDSAFNDPEDVSYVISPYIPNFLRVRTRGYVPTTNCLFRAAEAARGIQNTKAKLSENVIFSYSRVLIAEWLPFDSTQIFELNMRLGSYDRCKGFTDYITSNEGSEDLRTRVRVLDFHGESCVNFEAESQIEEEKGIVQVEQFGVHARADGCMLYGLQVEAVMLRLGDHVGAGVLARMCRDLQEDSSVIIHDMLSQVQRERIESVYGAEDHAMRPKQFVYMAEAIRPKLRAGQYMDDGIMESELSQLLGSLVKSYDVSKDLLVIRGTKGVLLVGTGAKTPEIEQMITPFIMLQSRADMLSQLFWKLMDIHIKLQQLLTEIQTFDTEWGKGDKMYDDSCRLFMDLSRMDALLQQMSMSIDGCLLPFAPRMDDPLRSLYLDLDCQSVQKTLAIRTASIMDATRRATSRIQAVQKAIANLPRSEFVKCSISSMFEGRVLKQRWLDRADKMKNRLKIAELVFIATFFMMAVDRLTGGKFTGSSNHVPASMGFITGIVDTPSAFAFLIGIIVTLGSLLLARLSKPAYVHVQRCHIKIACTVDNEGLAAFLRERKMAKVKANNQHHSAWSMVAKWKETDPFLWKGIPPSVEICWDSRGILHNVLFEFQYSHSRTHESVLWTILRDEMMEFDVFPKEQLRIWKAQALLI